MTGEGRVRDRKEIMTSMKRNFLQEFNRVLQGIFMRKKMTKKRKDISGDNIFYEAF